MRKIVLPVLMMLAMCFGCAGSGGGGGGSSGPELNYYLNAEVWIYEPRVTSIAIEFDRDLALGFDLTGNFSVNAELQQLTTITGKPLPESNWPMSPRTITRAYVSDRKEPGHVNPGRYVILELSPLDSNATYIYMNYKRFDEGGGGAREIHPYGDKLKYEIKQLYPVKYTDGTYTAANYRYKQAGASIAIADEFVPRTFTSNSTSITINVNGGEKAINSIGYTLYSPPSPEPGRVYPLVVYLHGSSCRSAYLDGVDDRFTPVYTNQGAVTWVKHGTRDCYVFVPQYQNDTLDIVKEAFDALLADPGLQIDPNRIYVAGLSMGGVSSWEMLLDPVRGPKFAAALISCGYPGRYSNTPWPAMISQLQAIARRGTKIWMTHSDLDPTVPVVGSFYAFKAIDNRAIDPNVLELPGIANGMPRPAVDFPQTQTFTSTAYGSQIRFTEILFVAGERNVDINMYSPSPHEVYENTYSTPEYIQWLFAQSK